MKEQLEEQMVNPELDMESRMRIGSALRDLDLALRGGKEEVGRTGDALIDRYERELASGREPDLTDRHRIED